MFRDGSSIIISPSLIYLQQVKQGLEGTAWHRVPGEENSLGFFPGDCMYLLVILKGVTHLYFHAKTGTIQ